MSRWLFDLGNTRLKCAPMDAAGRVGPIHAIGRTDPHQQKTVPQHDTRRVHQLQARAGA